MLIPQKVWSDLIGQNNVRPGSKFFCCYSPGMLWVLKYLCINSKLNSNIDGASVALKNPIYAMKGVVKYRVQRLRLVTIMFAKTLTSLRMYGFLKRHTRKH